MINMEEQQQFHGGPTRRFLLELPFVFAAGRVASAALSQLGEAEAPDNPDMFGVWWRGGQDAVKLKQEAPFVKGVFLALRWAEIEPADGKFDWSAFDAPFIQYANAGLYIQFMVWVGPDSPRWIYSAGVPEVRTTPSLDPHGKPHNWTYPFYLDNNYKRFYHRMIRAVAQHLDTLPKEVRNRVICIQTAEGTTGDEGGYKGDPLDIRYQLPRENWRAFKFETWKLFDSLYRPKRPAVHLLINSGNGGEYKDWLNTNLPDAWRKAGNPGHGYQLNDERNMMRFFDPLINYPENRRVRVRSEMDEMFKGWFQEAPVWNMYWLNLWGLHFGLDIFQHETEAFENRAFDEGFRFYEKYGGRKDPAASPGAWCAFHDGLDASDFHRFPAEQFGPGALHGDEQQQRQAIERTLQIAHAFEKYGARQGDPDKGIKLVMQNRDAKRMNNVGFNIEAAYSRFARSFDAVAGKNAMYFAFDRRFFSGKPLAGAYEVEISVIYLDRGVGSFALQYDAADAMKNALTIQKNDTGRWKKVSVPVADAYFGRRGPKQSDLVLAHASGDDTLFHMIEVTRQRGSQ